MIVKKLAKESNVLCIFIILIIGIFYLASIRTGHNWGGDFGMYIQHAKNISEGVNYRETGYIYNPSSPSLAPKMYPPIYPLLLSPVYKCFGLNLEAMKIEIILFFLFSLFIIFKVFKERLPFKYIVLLIAVLGFNPFFWQRKDNVLSDIPFLFFIYLSIYFTHKAYLSNSFKKNQMQSIILVSILFYLSYGTRNIGIVLIPSLFFYDIIMFFRKLHCPDKFIYNFIFFIMILCIKKSVIYRLYLF